MHNISGAFRDVSQSFGNYCNTMHQNALSVGVRFKELRNDPEFFQKVCQIAYASLQLIASLDAVSSIFFTTAAMHDFYRVIRYPRHWFFPVDSKAIDEFAALKDLTHYLAQEIVGKAESVFDEEEEEIELRDEVLDTLLCDIVKECLKDQLKLMEDNNDAYRSLDEFIGQLQKRLRKVESEDFNFGDFKFSELDLSGLNEANREYHVSQWIRHVPLIEKIMNINWAVVDVITVAWCAKEWNLFDTAKHAATIGQCRGFQWVQNQNLEHWLIGLVFSAYAWKLLEAVRKLRDEALTTEEKHQARWNAVASLAEMAFFGSLFTNLIGKTQINNAYVHLLAIGAKSLGLLSIATRPRHQFFQQPEAAPAA